MYIVTKIKNMTSNRECTVFFPKTNFVRINLMDIDTKQEILNLCCTTKSDDDFLRGELFLTGVNYEISYKDIIGMERDRIFKVTYREYILSTCLEYITEEHNIQNSSDKEVLQMERYVRGIYGMSSTIMSFILKFANTYCVELKDDYLYVYCWVNPTNCIKYTYKVLNKSLFSKLFLIG